MAQFSPLPEGAEAPIRLPVTPGPVSAQASGLGGSDTVSLFVGVGSSGPGIVGGEQSSGGSQELASFTTTATTSDAAAGSAMTSARQRAIDGCTGSSQPITLSDGTTATTCPTVDGAAINWRFDGWSVQVVTLGGGSPSSLAASTVDGDLRSDGLPAGDGPGFVSVVVPANASVGDAQTAEVAWRAGADDYDVRSQDDPAAALAIAAAMRPYPAG